MASYRQSQKVRFALGGIFRSFVYLLQIICFTVGFFRTLW